MFKGVDHVVIAVKDLEAAIKQYETIFGIEATDRGEPPGAGFKNAFFRFGPSYVELVSPTNEQGPVGRRVAASGDGVYLMALAVDDLPATLNELRAKGVRLLGDPGPDKPVSGQVFIHPGSANGVLTQLVQR
ncbi:MAG TPA: VOC family protein [Dehalococcoidia bacterium]|nr:VOC family protein [Dehalococcoidia bacterium]